MKYDVVIGIEMHVELKSKTKMFSASPITYQSSENSSTTPIDLGFPGTLPLVNKQGVILALRACMGLNCEIDPVLKFDRKNYFYSDLPKGYQITQQFYPIGKNGHVTLADGSIININRLHIEEDTAKQTHIDNKTLIDYNRAGNPLIEIVSEPDIKSGSQASEFVKKVSEILKYLEVSNVRMEEGSMRCDVNISLKEKNSETLGNKVEIKNLNSLNNIKRAVEFEIKRQSELLDNNQIILEETRRFDEGIAETVLMRAKDDSVDYKYFRDPNIPDILLSEDFILDVKNNLLELKEERFQRYLDLDLDEVSANILVDNKELSDFYDLVISNTSDIKAAYNWTVGDVNAYLNKNKLEVSQLLLKPNELAVLINSINDKTISSKQAKKVFDEIILGKTTKKVIKDLNLVVISDESEILKFIELAIEQNPQSVIDFKEGKSRALGFIVGQVMRLSQGKVDPALTNKLVKQHLESML